MKKPELRKRVQRLMGARKESQTALDEETSLVVGEDGAADGKVGKSQATLDEQTLKGLLAEYSALRNQILKTQERRLQIISLTVGALGVILSVTGNNILGSARIESTHLWIAIGSAITIYAIVIPSLTMISTQQTIEKLGGYIRLFIEPYVPGLNWERHWRNFKTRPEYKGDISMGGIYYFLSILPLLLPMYALSQYTQGWASVLVLVPFFFRSFYLSYNLRTGKSKRWEREQWEDYAHKHPPTDTYLSLPFGKTDQP